MKTIFFVRMILLTAFSMAASVSFADNSDLTVNGVKSNVDWDQVPVVEKVLFFPGVITYDWINSDKHLGTTKTGFKEKTCTDCHSGEEKGLGNLLIKADSVTLGDKKGFINAEFQFANDAEYLYIKASWATKTDGPARTHDTLLKTDDGKWLKVGRDVVRNPYNPMYEDRLSLMIDDGKVDQFSQQGCWMTCHRGMRDLGPAADFEVKALPVLGKSGLKKKDIRKYLPQTRTVASGLNWDKLKSQSEIDKLKKDGMFVDLMQWRSTRSAPLAAADDGYVLEYRKNDAGQGVFGSNIDKKTKLPKYMFDESVTGFYSLTKDDLTDLSKKIALIEGVNTMPYDATKIAPGQYLQGRYNREGKGSASDNKGVSATWENGKYTVVFKRKLDTGNPSDDKIMEVGKTYDFNIAIHDGQSTTRYHHVTFPFSIGIGEGAKGSIVTTTIK